MKNELYLFKKKAGLLQQLCECNLLLKIQCLF